MFKKQLKVTAMDILDEFSAKNGRLLARIGHYFRDCSLALTTNKLDSDLNRLEKSLSDFRANQLLCNQTIMQLMYTLYDKVNSDSDNQFIIIEENSALKSDLFSKPSTSGAKSLIQLNKSPKVDNTYEQQNKNHMNATNDNDMPIDPKDSHIVYDFHCIHCFKTFKSVHGLKIHLKTIHKTSNLLTFVCHQCRQEFPSKAGLSDHISVEHKKTILIYSSDDKTLIGCSVERRRRSSQTDILFECDINGCNTLFTIKRDLLAHKQHFHQNLFNKSIFICDYRDCGRHFGTEFGLKKHQTTHKYNHNSKRKTLKPFKRTKYKQQLINQIITYAINVQNKTDSKADGLKRPVGRPRKRGFIAPEGQNRELDSVSAPKRPRGRPRKYPTNQDRSQYMNRTIDTYFRSQNKFPVRRTDYPTVNPNSIQISESFDQQFSEPMIKTEIKTEFMEESEPEFGLITDLIRNQNRCPDLNKTVRNNQRFRGFDRNEGINGSKVSDSMEPSLPLASAEDTSYYRCTLCPKVFHSDLDLTLHVNSVHKKLETYLQCNHCKELFKSKEDLFRHLSSKHSIAKYKCDVCDYNASDPSAMIAHQKECQLFKCETIGCDKAFKSQEYLKQHMRTHVVFKCGINGCQKTFKDILLLNRHKNYDSHSETNLLQKITCDYPDCGQVFQFNRQLIEHKKTHLIGKQVKQISDNKTIETRLPCGQQIQIQTSADNSLLRACLSPQNKAFGFLKTTTGELLFMTGTNQQLKPSETIAGQEIVRTETTEQLNVYNTSADEQLLNANECTEMVLPTDEHLLNQISDDNQMLRSALTGQTSQTSGQELIMCVPSGQTNPTQTSGGHQSISDNTVVVNSVITTSSVNKPNIQRCFLIPRQSTPSAVPKTVLILSSDQNVCQICKKTFKSENDLVIHNFWFEKNIDTNCLKCHLRFNSEREAVFHKFSIHKQLFFKCNLCEYISQNEESVKIHIKDCKLSDKSIDVQSSNQSLVSNKTHLNSSLILKNILEKPVATQPIAPTVGSSTHVLKNVSIDRTVKDSNSMSSQLEVQLRPVINTQSVNEMAVLDKPIGQLSEVPVSSDVMPVPSSIVRINAMNNIFNTMDIRSEIELNSVSKPQMTTETNYQSTDRTVSSERIVSKPVSSSGPQVAPICDECLQMFDTETDLEIHVLTKHSVRSDKPFKCCLNDCKSSFDAPLELKAHLDSCHQRLQCLQCQQSFRTKESFESHSCIQID